MSEHTGCGGSASRHISPRCEGVRSGDRAQWACGVEGSVPACSSAAGDSPRPASRSQRTETAASQTAAPCSQHTPRQPSFIPRTKKGEAQSDRAVQCGWKGAHDFLFDLGRELHAENVLLEAAEHEWLEQGVR
eukprot:2199341-Rhodomonas_salina.2